MKIKNIIVLIGPPGSGKGTQGKLLAPILQYNYLSMGSTLRERAKQHKDIKKLIDKGLIIPDEMIRKIFFDAIKSLPKAGGLILDGFPRDINQVSVLDEALIKFSVDRVRAIFIDVPKAKILDRLKIRSGKESRRDDDPQVIETRFAEYDHKTYPLVHYFDNQHRLVRVNGDQGIEEVHGEIIRKLNHGTIRI